MTRPHDLVVIGAGPAGLAAAIEARMRDLSVLVVDYRSSPIDKPCGEGLMPDGLARLQMMGVELEEGSTGRFDGIRYLDHGVSLEGSFPEGVFGTGIRRLSLQRVMMKRALALGVELRRGRVKEVDPDRGSVKVCPGPEPNEDVELLEGRYIAAADGLRSPVRKALGLQKAPLINSPGRFGVRRHFAVKPWTRKVEVHWGKDAEAYVTPIAAGEIGVAILWSGRKAGFHELLASFPDLQLQIHGVETTSKVQGIGPLRQTTRAVVKGRVALVGDASGYVDAITGEGLSVAFHQAEALGNAVAQGDLRGYARRCREIVRQPNAMTELLLWLEKRPRLRRRAFAAMARDPRIFERFLAVHSRSVEGSKLLGVAPRLAWNLLLG